MRISDAGLSLIKEFEGLSLKSYICPAGVWTIGWGHTGPDVKANMTISETKADELLRQDVARFERAVQDLIVARINQAQFDALVSFTYNCGAGALEQSTLRKRLNNNEDPNKVAAEELPKWVKGEHGVTLPGLVERRKKEILLFTSGRAEKQKQNEIDITCTVDTFLKKEPIPSGDLRPDQKVRIKEDRSYKGAEVIAKKDKHTQLVFPYNLGTWWVFDEHWYGLKGVLNHPKDKAEIQYDGVKLAVPYQSQRDNYMDASRTCFSSSCAMAAMYLRPGCIKTDNDYLKKVFAIGDTVEVETQLKVLRSLGFNPKFKQNGTIEDLKQRLDEDIPCPVGILHKGPANAPTGSGHWVCVIGYQDEAKKFIVHDPWGQLDNYTGEYKSTNGEGVLYTYNFFFRRWMVEGEGTGWWIDLK